MHVETHNQHHSVVVVVVVLYFHLHLPILPNQSPSSEANPKMTAFIKGREIVEHHAGYG
jgi:hypothetical protein